MALYPKATYRPVSGLANDPPIIPIGVILHTRAGRGGSLFGYFNGPSGGIESHMYLTYDGKWEQYRDTTREADANLHGNSFVINGKRYGFLSVETEGMADEEWTPTQVAEIKDFLAWANKTHGIPLVVCPAWNKAGVGYHTMFGAPGPWTPVAKVCPGPKRIAQFKTVLVPWMKNPTTEEDDMPYTPDQLEQYAGVGVHQQQIGRSVLEDGKTKLTFGIAIERMYRATVTLQAQNTALAAAVKALATAQGANADQIEADIAAVVKDALKGLSITLTAGDAQ